MPERPDLEHLLPRLADLVRGRTVLAARVGLPVLLRVGVVGRLPELLPGLRFGEPARQLHFLRFPLGTLELLIHPMLAGRFEHGEPKEALPKDCGLALDLDDGTQLRFHDPEQMAKIHLIAAGQDKGVPGLFPVGLDVLDPAVFTWEAFRRLAKSRRDQVKMFLLDKGALDSFGNCYADEALFVAGIHPKARVRELEEPQLRALFAALPETLRAASRAIEAADPPLSRKHRDHVAVRNKAGQPCPRCGETIRVAGVNGHDAFFCPKCQPDEKGRGLVRWGR